MLPPVCCAVRGMLYEMDKEIRALRCRLASQEKDRADMVGVRGELRELMQKALKGMPLLIFIVSNSSLQTILCLSSNGV